MHLSERESCFKYNVDSDLHMDTSKEGRAVFATLLHNF
jgi:hypothetical protein